MDEKKDCEKCRKLNAVYERLQKNRELEIKNLWQRSIFLATFLVLCYTAYGALIGNLLNQCLNAEKICQYNIVAILTSFAGIIISVLWICMAKGSKAWQEVYEDAISDYEHRYWRDIPDEFHSDELKGDHNKRDRCLLSTKGGPFSPSKINIVIGQISFLIWICIAIGHIAYLILTCCQDIRCFSWTILVIAFVATIGLIIRLLYNPYKQNKTNNKADKVDKTDKANKPDRADKTVQNKDTVKSCQAPLNIVSKHLATTNDNIQDKEKAEKPESE